MKNVSIRLERLALGLAAVFVVLLLSTRVLGIRIPLLRPVVGIVLFGLIPGGLLLHSIGMGPQRGVIWLLYAIGASLVFGMIAGLLLSIILPLVGVEKPLTPIPLTLPYLLLVSGVYLWIRRRGTPLDVELEVPIRLNEIDIQHLLALILPLLSVLAITVLNGLEVTTPVVLLLGAIALVPAITVATRSSEKHFPLFIWSIALALLWHKSLWMGYNYTGHLAVAEIYESGVWGLEGNTLLINSVLMPGFAHLLGVGIMTQMKVILPVFVAFLPVAMYVTFENYTTPRLAFLGSCLFVFAHPFYYQYPSVARASMPVFFLVLVGVVMSDKDSSDVYRRALSVVFAFGIVVSHYGTSYYVMFTMFGALGLLYVFRGVDRGVQRAKSTYSKRSDGGRVDDSRSFLERLRPLSLSNYADILTWIFVILYAVLVISWYLYIDNGSKFYALTVRVVDAFLALLSGGGQGTTASRLATDYGAVSIRLSKYLYVLLGVLLALGLATTYLKRFLGSEEPAFDDDYLAVATFLLVLFGGTFILSGEWGGGRPMMIVLSLTSIFPAIAALQIASAIGRVYKTVAARVKGIRPDIDLQLRTGGQITFSVILAVFLLLNSGVVAAVAVGGEAPSNVPTTDPGEINRVFDIQTHAWLADHRDDRYQIYGDRRARAQTTDWLPAEIAVQSERRPYRFTKANLFFALNDSDVETGYVVMIYQNVEYDLVEVNYVTKRPIEAYELSLDRRNKVYSNGHGSVYFHPRAAGESTPVR